MSFDLVTVTFHEKGDCYSQHYGKGCRGQTFLTGRHICMISKWNKKYYNRLCTCSCHKIFLDDKVIHIFLAWVITKKNLILLNRVVPQKKNNIWRWSHKQPIFMEVFLFMIYQGFSASKKLFSTIFYSWPIAGVRQELYSKSPIFLELIFS